MQSAMDFEAFVEFRPAFGIKAFLAQRPLAVAWALQKAAGDQLLWWLDLDNFGDTRHAVLSIDYPVTFAVSSVVP